MASLVGSAPLVIGRNAAATTRMAKSPRPVSNERWRSSRCPVAPPALTRGAAASAPPMVSSVATPSATVVPHPRVEPGVSDIHGDVNADHDKRHEQERALDPWVVAVHDRA